MHSPEQAANTSDSDTSFAMQVKRLPDHQGRRGAQVSCLCLCSLPSVLGQTAESEDWVSPASLTAAGGVWMEPGTYAECYWPGVAGRANWWPGWQRSCHKRRWREARRAVVCASMRRTKGGFLGGKVVQGRCIVPARGDAAKALVRRRREFRVWRRERCLIH